MPEPPRPVPRRAGRVLLVDATGRALLLRVFDPADPGHPFWITVGGGADPGESLADAAARELREEVGVTADAAALGAPVWRRTAEFGFDGTRYHQEEEYFLLRVGSRELSLAGMEEIEQQTLLGYRWLTAADLEALAEPFFPPELPSLLRKLSGR